MAGQATEATPPPLMRQFAALFRMELVLLRRNLTAAVLIVVLPLVIGVARLGWIHVGEAGASAGADRMVSALGLIVVIFVHHHLVTVYATRRQELVLKKLRTGLLSDWVILTGAANSTIAVFLAQVLLLAGYGMLVLRFPVPANPVPILLAVLLAAALMTAVSAAMSGVTRSSEAAMLTTLPTMAFFLATPGMLVPYGTLPRGVEAAAWFLPMGPFGDLIRVGWLGRDASGTELDFFTGLAAALPGLAVMSGWLVLSVFAVRWLFRWQPRHG